MQRFLCLVLWSMLCIPAGAATFTFERTASLPELHRLTLVNDDAEHIVGFTLTIGDLTKNFDSMTVSAKSEGVVPMLIAPDGMNAGLRSDILSLAFSGLEPGKEVSMKVDIDGDTGSQTVDWQTCLFNNGTTENAILTVAWEGGTSSSLTLQDEPGRDALSPYVVTVPPVRVPEPSGMVLMLMAATSFLIRRFL